MEAIFLKKGIFVNNDINCARIRKTIMQIKVINPLRDPEKKILIEKRVSNKLIRKTLNIDRVLINKKIKPIIPKNTISRAKLVSIDKNPSIDSEGIPLEDVPSPIEKMLKNEANPFTDITKANRNNRFKNVIIKTLKPFFFVINSANK